MKRNSKFVIGVFVGILLIICFIFSIALLTYLDFTSQGSNETYDIPQIYTKEKLDEYLNTYDNVSMISPHYAYMSKRKMTRNSDLIIRGTIQEISSGYRDTNDGSAQDIYSSVFIYHDVVIEINEIYKGPADTKTVTVRRVGGVVDDAAVICLETFDYLENDEVVMYLSHFPNSTGSKYYVTHPRGEVLVYHDILLNAKGERVNLNPAKKYLV